MKATIFIPEKIKVGYQHRLDTYTQKLAYVIYYDNKGVLRKETSWKGWIHDKPTTVGQYVDGKWTQIQKDGIPPDDFDNVPMEGFVLNKKVGGNNGSWNPRQTYTRVYDPRGFEFEITVPNLLYILEHANSIKGKGLEGKFVYGWDGKELVLIPENAPEYAAMQAFTQMQSNKVGKADMIPGLKYLTKKNEEVTYLGWYEEQTYSKTVKPKKKHWFMTSFKTYHGVVHTHIQTTTGLTHLAGKISDDPDPKFPEYFERMERDSRYSAISHYSLKDISAAEKRQTLENDYGTAWYLKTDKDKVVQVHVRKHHTQNVTGATQYYISNVWECENTGSYASKTHHSSSWMDAYKLLGLDPRSSNTGYFTADQLFERFRFLKKVTHLKNGKTTEK